MTWICVIGIELNAKTQIGLLGAEIAALGLFAVVALVARLRRRRRSTPRSIRRCSWFNPFEIGSISALTVGRPDRGLHLLGLGHDGHGERGDRGLGRDAGPRGDRLDADPASRTYVIVTVAALAFGGPERLANDDSDDVLGVLGQRRLRQRPARQDRDHRGAHVGGGVDARRRSCRPRARRCRWRARKAHAGEARRDPPALPDPARLDDLLMGVDLGRLVRRPDARLREHPVRRDRRARPDDRLLLRHHGVRLHDLLPPRGRAQRAQLRDARRRAGARRPDARLRVREVLHRPRGPGELRVGRLVARARAAASSSGSASCCSASCS